MPNTPVSPDPNWDSADVSALRAFLETPTGKKVIQVLANLRPGLSGDTLERVALRAKKSEGYEACMGTLFSMAYPAADAASQQSFSAVYPDLDDDSQWPQPAEPKK